jgi:hypothetical protein
MKDVQVITVAGGDALTELDRLRSEYAKTGLYPIILGSPEDYRRIEDIIGDESDPAAILKESESINAEEWFRAQPQFGAGELDEGEDEFDFEEAQGAKLEIITHRDILTGQPKPEVLIGLFKVAAPWEAFAMLDWGNWNESPSSAAHCAIQRYWAKQYGSEVVSITSDVVQCTVARPPQNLEASRQLALEQYCYCGDIVDQGTGTVERLAAGLLDSKVWYFWWD